MGGNDRLGDGVEKRRYCCFPCCCFGVVLSATESSFLLIEMIELSSTTVG